MNKKIKFALISLLFLITVGIVVGYMFWNKPTRNVENEEGIMVTSARLVKEYVDNEPEADKKYLDKAIQVTGQVSEVKNNQDGKPTVMLTSDDVFTGVYCTLKDNTIAVTAGSIVTIKGICSGKLSDVRLRQAVVVK